MKTSSLLINEPPLLVLPSLAKAIGLNEAIITQQLHYWLENQKAGVERDGFKWVFNTYDEWQENFPFWSVSTIKRVFLELEEKQVVISAQLDAKSRDMRKYYRLNYELLWTMQQVNLTPSISSHRDDVKGNTETTTENNKADAVPAEFGLDWKLASGGEINQQDKFTAEARDAANLMDTGCAGAGELAYAFMTTRRIIIPEGKIKGNRKAAREMLEMHVKPQHVKQATLELIEKQMTVTDLFSVVKTATALANPAKTDSTIPVTIDADGIPESY